MSKRFPGHRFSYGRLLIAITVFAAFVVAIVVAVTYQVQSLKPLSAPWSGGYVDVTETPSYEFESQTGEGQNNLILAFVVASNESCTPSWGNYYTLDAANSSLDLDRRIAQVQRSGRTAMISFGGRDNMDLAMACPDTASLKEALGTTINRYNIDAVDFDIEGDDLTDVVSRHRRAEAVAALQTEAVNEGGNLAVWVTLPADRNGLTQSGLETVNAFLEAGVNLAGVNLMTMNFGVSSTEVSMSTLAQESLKSAHAQLLRFFLAKGQIVTPAQVWTMLGATPMVGQNDERDEVFTIQDAVSLHTFAQANNVGRLSIWSLNRDRQCAANYTDWRTAANFCSGINQSTLEFTNIFAVERIGDASQVPEQSLPLVPQSSDPTELKVDDPATSPYPIWSAETTYAIGDKVVWRQNVYVALWANKGYEPDLAVQDANSAWRLIGPVLEGESPQERPVLPEGTYPEWTSEAIYDAGDLVMYNGIGYRAKWWTQGDSPELAQASDASPWERLTDEEVELILKSA